MNPRKFFAELKRRNIYKVAVAYAIVGWLIMQVAATAVPALHLPGAVTSAVVLLTILGFPIALVLAWAFELTPEGIKRTEEVAPQESIARSTGRKLDFTIIGVLALAVTLLLFDRLGVIGTRTRGVDKNENRPSGPSLPQKSIAVLPFDNLSRDPDNAFFTDGVQDQILTALAKVADLKVISRTSVMQYKSGAARNLREIGRQLGVAHLLEGSVQRAGNKVRVNAQLIDARTDAHEWAENYDRPVDDVFAIQSEIAKAIADQLQAKLSPNEKAAIEQPPTADLTAFTLYARAKTLVLNTSFSALAGQNLTQATELLNQAVARDPQFFLAYCLLVDAHSVIYQLSDHTSARRAAAEAAVQAAARLRPDAGETHLARGDFLYTCDRNYDAALSELNLAAKKLPNNAQIPEFIGYIRRRQGLWDESLPQLEKALQLDPRNFFTLQQIGLTYYYMRRYADTEAVLDRALTLMPNDPDTRVFRARTELEARADAKPLHDTIHSVIAAEPDAVAGLGNEWFYLALCERSKAELEEVLKSLPASGVFTDAVRFPLAYCKGVALRLTGDTAGAAEAFTRARAEVERSIQEQPDYGPPLCVLGLIDAALGRKDDAIREGRRACELLPVQKDSINGAHMKKYLASIYAMVGEKDLAIEQIKATLQVPGELSYGNLRLHPDWDPLRGDPRFEQIVASLAPKETGR